MSPYLRRLQFGLSTSILFMALFAAGTIAMTKCSLAVLRDASRRRGQLGKI